MTDGEIFSRFNIKRQVHRRARDFSEPQLLGHYSLDGDRTYHDDLSQLQYYKKPSNPNNVSFNLDKDYNKTIHKIEGNLRIDMILKWMSEHFDDLRLTRSTSKSSKTRWLEPQIVCFRGVITDLMKTADGSDFGWIICASKFEGTIYLCMYDTYNKEHDRKNESPFRRKATAWGHKFEQFIFAESPSADPDLSVPCNQNKEFCCIFKTQFNNTKLLYGAEIDGVCSDQVITDTLVGKPVELIEAKTTHINNVDPITKNLKSPHPAAMLKWWYQSHLVGIKKIVFGHKSNSGFVKSVKEEHLTDIKNMIEKRYYKEAIVNGIDFCNAFIEYIKIVVEDDYDEYIYKFSLDPKGKEVKTSKHKPEDASEFTFLPKWYIDAAMNYKKR